MASSDLSTMVTKMKQTQKSTTLGWDVVVNYGETELNNLLSAAYNADSTGNKAIKDFPCSVNVIDPDTGDYYQIDYILNFGSPLIMFLETDMGSMCNLTIPVMGGTATRNGDSPEGAQIIGENVYTITLKNLLLSTAKGGVTDDTVSPENPTPYDKPFVFPTNSEESGVVFIDFEASKQNLAVDLTFTGPDVCKLNDPNPACAGRSPRVDSQIGNLKDTIRNELLTTYKHVIYELARVNNSQSSASLQLVPKCFMFGTFLPDDGETILSLFIQTGDTNYGIQSRLNSNWNVLWGTTIGCAPIPSEKTETSSIIFSKDLVYNSMIKPSLEKQGYSVQWDDTKLGGIYLSVDTKKKLEEPEYTVWNDPLLITYHSAINVTLPKLQLILEQDPTSKPGYCRGSWYYEYRFSWSAAILLLGETRGSATVKNTLDDTFAIKLTDDYTLTLDFNIQKSDWKVTVIPDSVDFWDKLGGKSGQTPDWILGMNIGIPDLEINMGSLDYFLTTNLLLPNRRVIDIDTKLGVQIPGDLFIVGSVETS